MEDNVEPDVAGFFHATSRYRAVRRLGLRARRQLGGIVGLGGGGWNVAPNLVSFVPEHFMAHDLARAIQLMAGAARGEVTAYHAVEAALAWMSFPEHDVYQDYFQLTWDDPLLEAEVTGKLHDIAQALNIDTAGVDPADLMDARTWSRLMMEQRGALLGVRNPKVYESVQEAEELVQRYFWPSDSDIFQCAPFFGFTATAEQFARIDPCDVGVVWAEVRLDATADLHPLECELRFSPQDVRVVGGELLPCYDEAHE